MTSHIKLILMEDSLTDHWLMEMSSLKECSKFLTKKAQLKNITECITKETVCVIPLFYVSRFFTLSLSVAIQTAIKHSIPVLSNKVFPICSV